jgi:hypothetical protein
MKLLHMDIEPEQLLPISLDHYIDPNGTSHQLVELSLQLQLPQSHLGYQRSNT